VSPAARRLVRSLAAVALTAAPAAALAAGAPAAAQTVERRGVGDPQADAMLDAILLSDPLLVTRDTLIAPGDTIRRPVLVLGVRFTMEGTVTGELAGVDAELFLRPFAHVHGGVLNLVGGLYRSELAAIDGAVLNLPAGPYRLLRDGDHYVIEGLTRRVAWTPDGILGFHLPTYDRVDALTVTWGGTYRPGGTTRALARHDPRIHARVDVRSRSPALTGGATASVGTEPLILAAGAERTTVTHDDWAAGDGRNTLDFLLLGRDHRDYYRADRVFAEVRATGRAGAFGWEATIRGQTEAASSLTSGSPWTLFGDPYRFNPPVFEERYGSLIAVATARWAGPTAGFEGGTLLEAAGQGSAGGPPFNRYVVHGAWGMEALAEHELRLRWRLQGPLPGTDELPPQRHVILGGPATLPAHPIAAFRGDRLAFLETDYLARLPDAVRLPVVGTPDLRLTYAVGRAWTRDEEAADMAQSLTVRLEFFVVYVGVVVDPGSGVRSGSLTVGVFWPWEGMPGR
jgi:hypothetical protein